MDFRPAAHAHVATRSITRLMVEFWTFSIVPRITTSDNPLPFGERNKLRSKSLPSIAGVPHATKLRGKKELQLDLNTVLWRGKYFL